MNNIDKQYQKLLQDIIDNGVEKKDRTGTGTISVFGRQIRHKMSEGFPLLTTKKMAWKTMVTELLWFLRGDTNIKYLVDNNCHIWDGDAYKNYCLSYKDGHEFYEDETVKRSYTQEEFINKIKTDDEFAKKWGELGPIYGKQWRNWMGFHEGQHDILKVVNGVEQHKDYLVGKDQIWNLINDLKTNPDSRRLMVSAWNVGDLDKMTLPPCHYGFQVYTRELTQGDRVGYGLEIGKIYSSELIDCTFDIMENILNRRNIPTRAISLMWNQRSVDTFLGLPFNIASYGLLLEIIAKVVNMVPDELIGNLGDTHLYLNHIEQAKEQIGRKYTSEERHEMLKTAMGDFYKTAVDEQVPFGGGLSEYYGTYKIPNHTREPFELPTLNMAKTNAFWNGFDVSLFGHLDPTDFMIENYQSHPTIKAPLSN
jgi:thymidylate synthase